MSEPQRISPLLDGYTMGEPMANHDGIQCCPAIKENTEEKYIVKIISVPATQAQMDALLLAGAYKDPADAMDYFKEMGKGILQEARLLSELSKLNGFTSYDAWQMTPITRKRLGYYVYLIGSYKCSLEKHLRRSPVTHLEAVNLGLDLCSALSLCRQSGSLYVDLKPSNIFVCENKEYCIGDLGFLPLDALRYSTIPDRYRSAYTPPELFDPMNPVNLTVDTYAVGMILYQLYNDGQLPRQERDPEEALPTPVNADYELADIIMKAIHPDPEQRWQDPKDLAQALVAYMQRNAVNDTSITPHTPLEPDPNGPLLPQEPKPEEPKSEEPEQAPAPEADEAQTAAPDPEPDTQLPEEGAEPEEAAAQEEDADAQTPPSEPSPAPEEPEPDMLPQDAADDQDTPELMPHEMSDELSRIMAKADDLISHQPPEGVVLPQIPDPPDPFAFVKEDMEPEDDGSVPKELEMEQPEPTEPDSGKKGGSFISPEGKRRRKKLVATLAFLLALSAAGLGSYWFYQNIYLQTIRAIDIDGTKQSLTVNIDSDVKDGLLRVICSDKNGASMTQNVVGGQATFTGLTPDTLYTVRLEIDGFHALVGKTSDIFTTDTTTSIVSLTPTAGTEDGSVILDFTVEGIEPEQWTLTYGAQGEPEQVLTFTGHQVPVSGLKIGKVYTFVLDAGDSLSLSGETTLEYMATRLVLAKDLWATSTDGTDLTMHWNVPGDLVVDSWQVRCYNDSGYDESQTVTDTQALFTGIDPELDYTVEVTAEGMTEPARISITANALFLNDFTVANDEDTQAQDLRLEWSFTGSEPQDGWLLMYTVDGSAMPNVVKCSGSSGVISPRIPGAQYQFTLQAADGTTVLNSRHSYTCPEAAPMDANSLQADQISGKLLKTPEGTWHKDSLEGDDYTDQFAPGESVSLVLHGDANFYLPGYELNILYVIRDAHGIVLPDLISQERTYWKEFWSGGDSHYGELTLPKVPEIPGSYVLHLYFDGAQVGQFPFTITH